MRSRGSAFAVRAVIRMRRATTRPCVSSRQRGSAASGMAAYPTAGLAGWPDGRTDGAAAALGRSAACQRNIASLLNSETSVPDITRAPLRPEFTAIAGPSTVGGRYMACEDFSVAGADGVLRPG